MICVERATHISTLDHFASLIVAHPGWTLIQLQLRQTARRSGTGHRDTAEILSVIERMKQREVSAFK